MPYKEFEVDGLGKIKIYKRKANRSLRLTIAADGNIRVSIPFWIPYRAGIAFTLSKKDWIQAQNQRSIDLLADGQKIGKSHRLVFRTDPGVTNARSNIRQTEIVITHHPKLNASDEQVQTVARTASWRALRLQAQKLLSQRLEQLAQEHKLSYKSLHIKRMKSRWGSCDQHTNIVLNLYLIQLPWELIDYVILHELTHTKVLHHGPKFWSMLESLKPEARQLRKAIKAYRPTLLVI